MGKYRIPRQSEFDKWNKVVAVDANGHEVGVYDTGLGPLFPFYPQVYADIMKRICSGGPFQPIRLEIAPTDFCNHRCRMCIVRYYYERLGHRRHQLDRVLLQSLIHDAEEIGVKLITLSGTGEIFTYPGIESVLKDFLDNSLNLMVFTNGSILSEESAEYLVRSNAIINISINAGEKESYRKINGKDDYEAVCSNMEKLKEKAVKYGAEPVLGCSFVVLPANVAGISLAAERSKALGFDFITYKPAAEVNDIPDFAQHERVLLAERLEEAKSFTSPDFRVNINFDPSNYSLPYRRPAPLSPKCFQGVFSLNVASNGGLYPCPTQATSRSSQRVFNVSQISLRKFIRTDYFRTFHYNSFRDDALHRDCFNDLFNRFANWLYEMITIHGGVSVSLAQR